MPNHQKENTSNKSPIGIKLANWLKSEIPFSGKDQKEISMIFGKDKEPYLSGLLGTRTTSNIDLYRKIAHAINISDRRFNEKVAQFEIEVIEEKYPTAFEEACVKYALSTKGGGKQDARDMALKKIKDSLKELGY